MDDTSLPSALQALRERAEQRRVVSASLPSNTSPEVQKLVQELQVHQIELQMQYEELLLAQAEVEASRAQYLDLYEFAPVGYCTIDAAGTLLQLNLRTAQLLGTVRQRLVGRRLLLFVDQEARAVFIAFLAKLWARPGERLTCELAMRQQDETPFFTQLEGVVTAANPDTRQPATGRLVLLDSTARHQAAASLAASEERFRATFQQSRDGMLLLDDHHFVDVNDAGVWMLRRADPRQVVGHHVAEFWPEHQPSGRRSVDVLTDCMVRARAEGWCRIEWMRHDSAGQPVWDEMSFNPVQVQGKSLIHGVWRDITERKRLQQAERDRQQQLAEAVLAAEESEKRRIAESLHNGLAQQLYAAKLSLGQLQSQQCRDDPGTFTLAHQKTSQLLAAAIVQTRTLSHELIPRTLLDFGLEAALQDICTDYSTAPLCMRCRIEGLPEALPAHLLLALYRMAQELANNIVKHAQATEASLRIAVADDTIELRAQDNGVGFRADLPAKPTGMGWQTLQDRVRLLNGTLELKSTPSISGTCVTIQLPVPA
ncbi:MAG: PAS domain S-box protein [Cytophagaceae bacterium]|nr:MAG: PAS domain S-box protein [Cytophagaceae bacterium]